MSVGPAEIIVVFVVALLVFGPTKLPELSRQLGRGLRELRSFQRTLKGELDELMEHADDEVDEPRPRRAPPVRGDGREPEAEAGNEAG